MHLKCLFLSSFYVFILAKFDIFSFYSHFGAECIRGLNPSGVIVGCFIQVGIFAGEMCAIFFLFFFVFSEKDFFSKASVYSTVQFFFFFF